MKGQRCFNSGSGAAGNSWEPTSTRFDRIIINNLLEYVEDIQGLFQNCRRLLTPRGRILNTTLNPFGPPF